MSIDDLENASARARIRHLGAVLGFEVRESGREGGFQAVMSSPADGDALFFAVAPLGGGYVSLSLVLVVDEDFFREHIEEVLAVTARYDACVSLARDGKLEEGEVYLNLSLRLFLAGLCEETLGLAVQNLRAARDALGGAFP
jgi:hypothetical protein